MNSNPLIASLSEIGCQCIFGLLLTCSVGLSSRADGLDHWHQRNPAPTADVFYGCAYQHGCYVAVGETGALFTSRDGTTWTFKNLGISFPLYGIIYGGDKFVAVGDRPSGNSIILSSSDSIEWSENDSKTTHGLISATFGSGMFVAVGAGVVRSTNGTDWAYVGQAVPTLAGVAYGSGLFVAVGEGGRLTVSTNGLNWSPRPSGVNKTLRGITYGKQRFVAVGASGTATTSVDGYSWTPLALPGITSDLRGITYAAGHFVAVGAAGMIVTSRDGLNWKQRSSGTSEILTGICYSGWTFIAVGDKGTFLESDPIVALEQASFGNKAFQFSFMTEARHRYEVLTTKDLLTHSVITNLAGAGEIIQFTDPAEGTGFSFYSIRSE